MYHSTEVYLNEGYAISIVRDGQPKGILRLQDVNNFWLSTNMCEDKIIKPQLSSK